MSKRFAILALAVWFGGLNCLAGCAAEVLAAHLPSHVPATESRECTDGCCKRESGSAPAQDEHQSPAHNEECCPFLTAPPSLLAKKLEVAPAGVLQNAPSEDLRIATDFSVESFLEDSFASDGRQTHQRYHVLRI